MFTKKKCHNFQLYLITKASYYFLVITIFNYAYEYAEFPIHLFNWKQMFLLQWVILITCTTVSLLLVSEHTGKSNIQILQDSLYGYEVNCLFILFFYYSSSVIINNFIEHCICHIIIIIMYTVQHFIWLVPKFQFKLLSVLLV